MNELKISVLKTFQLCSTHFDVWNEIIDSCSTSLGTLKHLCEQCESIINAPECVLSLTFPHLRNELKLSVRNLMDEELKLIHTKMDELSSLNHKLKNMWEITYKMFLKTLPSLKSEESLYQGTELHPPLCDMIKWIEDIYLIYSNKFIDMKDQLYQFDCTPTSVCKLRAKFDSSKSPKAVDLMLVKVHNFINDSSNK